MTRMISKVTFAAIAFAMLAGAVGVSFVHAQGEP